MNLKHHSSNAVLVGNTVVDVTRLYTKLEGFEQACQLSAAGVCVRMEWDNANSTHVNISRLDIGPEDGLFTDFAGAAHAYNWLGVPSRYVAVTYTAA
jgi:hypothetical protein